MNEKLKKVIIHEIGHYVARMLNLRVLGVGYGIDRILLVRRAPEVYEGQTIPIKPENYQETQPIKDLPEFIAVLVYGCIFESLYLKTSFAECFAIHAVGKRDLEAYSFWTEELIPQNECQVLRDCIRGYYHNLQINIKEFDQIFQLNYANVLIAEDFGYSIDLDKLHGTLSTFFLNHQVTYMNFIEKLSAIISGVKTIAPK